MALQQLRPPPDRTIDQWAEQERYLYSNPTRYKGRWNNSRCPYLVEPMREATNPRVSRILFIGASQSAKTEFEMNVIGATVQDRPRPIVVVLPKEGSASTLATDRFWPMVRDSPGLATRVGKTSTRKGKETTLEVVFDGGQIAFVSAMTPNDLAMRPAGLLIFEESKSYDTIKEGSPKAIARARTAAFPDALEVDVTSPHLKDSQLYLDWCQSDQRYFMVPCPHCEQRQRLVWREKREDGEFYGVIWDSYVDQETDKRLHDTSTARYRCKYCLGDWNDSLRVKAVRKGTWEPTNPNGRFPGFHISAIYSSLIKGLHKIVEAFVDCGKDPEELKAFFNTKLAEFWDDVGERIDAIPLFSRRENYRPDLLPAKVVFLTAGVDVQDDRIECTVVGWGPGEESWVIEHHVIYGNPELIGAQVWTELDLRLAKTYKHPTGASLRIWSTCIDSGHHTQTVYKFCVQRWDRNIWAVKGKGTPDVEIVSDKPSTNNVERCPLWTIGTNKVGEIVWRRTQLDPGEPPSIHFPLTLGEEYFRQFTAEERVRGRVNGRDVHYFRKRHQRNEALDCYRYAFVAYIRSNPDLEEYRRLILEGEARRRSSASEDDDQGLGGLEWLYG